MKFNLAVTTKEYDIVFDAVTNEICELFRNNVFDEQKSLLNVTDTTVGKACFSSTCRNNRIICALFQQDIISIPSSVFYWRNFVPDSQWKNVWTFHQKLMINNKMKDVSFKLLHRIYPTNQFMKKYIKTIDPNCKFCKEHSETISHLFWNCYVIKTFWKHCNNFIICNID